MAEVMLDTIWQPTTQQQIYRQLLTAMSYPAEAQDLGTLLDSEAAVAGVCATLIDQAVSVADPDDVLGVDRLRFLAAATAAPAAADFIVIDGRRPPPTAWEPRLGTVFQPEAGATLIIQVDAVDHGTGWSAVGPGIDGRRLFNLDGLADGWMAQRNRWCADFPLGVDCLFCDAAGCLALPRTTQVEGD